MQQQVRILQLLQRSLKGLDEMMRQLGNEADGIGQQDLQMIRHLQAAGRRVQRVKQPVVGRDARARKSVEQGGLARIRVADQRHDGHGVLHAALTLRGAHAAHLVQLRLQAGDALADVAAVRFELRFAGAARADAAAQAGHRSAHAGELRQQVLILRQLDLQAALGRFGALGKDIQNQGAAVQDGRIRQLLQRADLGRREVVVKYNERRPRALEQSAHLLRLSLADEAVRVRRVAVLQHLCLTDAARRLEESLQLVQRLVRGILLRPEAVRAQADQDGLLCFDSIILLHDYLQNSDCAPQSR